MATATELRRYLALLSDDATADLAALWANLTLTDVDAALRDVLPALVDNYSAGAALVSAEWYDEHRADLNVPGTYAAEVPPAAANVGVDALAGWGSSLAAENWDTALELISGGLQRRIVNAGREVITGNVFRDPQGRGWQRQARADGCGFCQMLAGRGTVYRSQGTADFGAHDHCHCLALPAFSDRPVPVRKYTPTARTITDADRARTREWIAHNL